MVIDMTDFEKALEEVKARRALTPRRKKMWWMLVRRARDVRRIPFEVRCKVQRARSGWSVGDAFSFDDYLARVIAEGVEHLRERAHGHPCELTMEEWDEILRKIAEGFRFYVEKNYEVFGVDKDPRYVEAMALFAQWMPGLWD